MPHYSGIVTPRERPLHFLHIGKTGGTAVKHALKPVAAAGHLMLHGHDVRLHDVAPGEQVFFFLRDPLSCFVSAFYSRQREGRRPGHVDAERDQSRPIRLPPAR